MTPGRSPDVEDVQFIDVLRSREDPVLTTKEIAQELPIGERAVIKRLTTLHNRGLVERKDVGGNSVWWVPIPPDAPDQKLIQQAVQHRNRYKHANSPPDSTRQLNEEIAQLDIPATEETETARRQAVAAAYAYLQKQENVPKREFIENLYVKHSAGYDSPRSWWEKLIRPALKQLTTVENATRKGTWSYQGESTDVEAEAVRSRLPEDIEELNHLLYDGWNPDSASERPELVRDVGRHIVRLLARKHRVSESELIDSLSAIRESSQLNEKEFWSELVLPVLTRIEDLGIVRRDSIDNDPEQSYWVWQVIPLGGDE